MEFGFLTSLLNSMGFEGIVEWAKERGFSCIEAAAWPKGADKICIYYAATVDAGSLDEEEALKKKAVLDKHGIRISSLAYYDNNLEPDDDKRRSIHEHLKAVIKAAHLLGVELVGTFIGRDPHCDIKENIAKAIPIIKDFTDYAGDLGVTLMIENCPMVGWQREHLIGNVFYEPSIWERFFERIESKSFGMNFDPSHLTWQRIDYCEVMREFADKIRHFHAKDTQVVEDVLHRNGIYSEGWWKPVIPAGDGDINWGSVFNTIKEIGYKGPVSVEFEDERYETSQEKVKEGLVKTLHYLQSQL